jgi:hypothetical protein
MRDKKRSGDILQSGRVDPADDRIISNIQVIIKIYEIMLKAGGKNRQGNCKNQQDRDNDFIFLHGRINA